MTDEQHHDKFDWATELSDAQGHVTLSEQEAHEIGARLRSLGEKLKTYEDLGDAADDVHLLRTGYAAARLEIESLRAAQPAGAQQPGATYAAVTDERAAFEEMMRSQTFDSLKRLSDGSYESYEARVGWMAWNARASHGQAPAQPVVPAFTEAQIASACLSYRHDFGLLGETDRKSMMWIARQWERAFAKEREFAAPAQAAPVRDYPQLPDFDTVEQPSPTPQADTQPAPDEIINMAREQGLPETETEGVFIVNVDDLGRIFAAYRAARAPADSVTAPAGGVVAYLDIGAGGYLDLGTDLSNEALSRLPKGRNELVIAGTYGIDGYTPTPPTQAADSVLDVAFDAVRKKLCALPRYSFVLDDDGLVRRVLDRSGNWIEFDEAHALFDPVSVDAARKQGANHD